MSVTSERNGEIINQLSSHKDRFILVGSLARGILLGNDISELDDKRRKHFLDVDVVDRTGKRRDQYHFMDGLLDSQTTKSIRPVSENSTTWGFFDSHDNIALPSHPISTFGESDLHLRDVEFSRLHPGATVTVPSIPSMLFFSDYMQYSHNMPKHHQQIQALKDQVSETEIPSGLSNAYSLYTSEMEARYTTLPYLRARRIFFNIAPKIAYGIQQNTLGRAIRSARGIDERIDLPLDTIDL